MVQYKNSWIEIPNELTLGSLLYSKIINGDYLKSWNDFNETKESYGYAYFNLPDCMEILSKSRTENGFYNVISLRFGLLRVHSYNENVLIESNLCTIYKICKLFKEKGIHFNVIGDKFYININK